MPGAEPCGRSERGAAPLPQPTGNGGVEKALEQGEKKKWGRGKDRTEDI